MLLLRARLYAVFKRSLLILLLDPLLRFQAFLSPKTRTLDTKAYFIYPLLFWSYKYYWLVFDELTHCCWWHQVEIGFSVLQPRTLLTKGIFIQWTAALPTRSPVDGLRIGEDTSVTTSKTWHHRLTAKAIQCISRFLTGYATWLLRAAAGRKFIKMQLPRQKQYPHEKCSSLVRGWRRLKAGKTSFLAALTIWKTIK